MPREKYQGEVIQSVLQRGLDRIPRCLGSSAASARVGIPPKGAFETSFEVEVGGTRGGAPQHPHHGDHAQCFHHYGSSLLGRRPFDARHAARAAVESVNEFAVRTSSRDTLTRLTEPFIGRRLGIGPPSGPITPRGRGRSGRCGHAEPREPGRRWRRILHPDGTG